MAPSGQSSDPPHFLPAPPMPPFLAAVDCSAMEGAKFSSCGPACPRSCDDIAVRLECAPLPPSVGSPPGILWGLQNPKEHRNGGRSVPPFLLLGPVPPACGEGWKGRRRRTLGATSGEDPCFWPSAPHRAGSQHLMGLKEAQALPRHKLPHSQARKGELSGGLLFLLLQSE